MESRNVLQSVLATLACAVLFGACAQKQPRAAREIPARILVFATPAAGAGPMQSPLEVELIGRERAVVARPRGGDDPAFMADVPPGRYLVVARAGALVGVTELGSVVDGQMRDVYPEMQPEVSITGRVRTPSGRTLQVESAWSWPTGFSGGRPHPMAYVPLAQRKPGRPSFVVGGLARGRTYDIVVRLASGACVEARAVAAPHRDLVIETSWEPRSLKGAVGLAAGPDVPKGPVQLSESVDMLARLDGRGRFEAHEVPGGSLVRVTLSANDLYFESTAVIPPDRDPDPICLAPPCAERRQGARGEVIVLLEGDPYPSLDQQYVLIDVRFADSNAAPEKRTCDLEGIGSPKCSAGRFIEGTPLWLRIHRSGCAEEKIAFKVAPGENRKTVACRKKVRVVGTIRGGAKDLQVSCGEGEERIVVQNDYVSPAFGIECPPSVQTLSYWKEGGWRSVPLPAPSQSGVMTLTLD